jgi:hypothetical protein
MVSEITCVHLPIFEHAEIDRCTEQSVRCVGAEAPFNMWSVDAAHLPGELAFVKASHAGGPGFEPVFRVSIGSDMGARENALRRLFFPSG